MKDLIETVELFPIINNKLLELLNSLSIDDFNQKTQFPSWRVRDICAHLLDTSIRRLSTGRDHFQSQEKIKITSHDELIQHITDVADRWTLAFSGISPRIMIELISNYQNQLYEYLKTLNPFESASMPVSWAGEETSFNWFDIAREYTERWHHQMQIREALGKEPLYEKRLYYPVLDTFLRALPYHYRNWKMEDGYVLCINIEGGSGGKWYLVWNQEIELRSNTDTAPHTIVNIQQNNAWKIFTRWTDKDVYKAEIIGNQELGKHIFQMNCLLIKQ